MNTDNPTPTPTPNLQPLRANRYALTVLKKIGDRVLEWSIIDGHTPSAPGVGTTIAQGDAMGYESALEIVHLANFGWRTFVVEVSQ